MSVQGEIKGDKLILTIDISATARGNASPSSSGKTLSLASTGGFTRFGDIDVSLNATLPNPNKARDIALAKARDDKAKAEAAAMAAAAKAAVA